MKKNIYDNRNALKTPKGFTKRHAGVVVLNAHWNNGNKCFAFEGETEYPIFNSETYRLYEMAKTEAERDLLLIPSIVEHNDRVISRLDEQIELLQSIRKNLKDENRNLKGATVKDMEITLPILLTVENAAKVSTISNINHPEWGSKRFNFDASKDKFHSHGSGSNSAMLFEHEFKFWKVETWK